MHWLTYALDLPRLVLNKLFYEFSRIRYLNASS
jgi:hypothetical protein